MDAIVTQMIILFILVIIGYYLSKKKMMDADFDRKLSGLVINVTCPSLILSSVMGDTLPDKTLILPLLVVGFATYVVLIGLAFLLPRYLPVKLSDRGIYSFMLAFGNVGFIGYPIVASIFGASAVFYASILNFPSTLLIFVFGTLFISGGQGKMRFDWRTLYCPAMIASYLSILIVVTGWVPPRVISTPVCPVGKCHRACCAAHHRLVHCPCTHSPDVWQYGHLPDVGLASDAGSTPYFVSLTPLPGGRNHCQYQCGAGGHARSFVRHPVLYPVSERGDHHGRRNLPHYLAFRTEHSVADDVPVDLFQQGCIRLFGFMRQYLLELGEHPFA